MRVWRKSSFTGQRPVRPSKVFLSMAMVGNEESGDHLVIAAVLAGDRERFGELVEHHQEAVWGVIARFLPNQDDAREVFQETWLRALERLQSLRDPERLRSWLFSIALNQCRSRHRARSLAPRQLRLVGESETERGLLEPAATTLGPVELLTRRDESERFAAAIAHLPARQREVLELRLSGGLSHAEIATVLGIREDSARANLYQAMRRLKAQLQPDEG